MDLGLGRYRGPARNRAGRPVKVSVLDFETITMSAGGGRFVADTSQPRWRHHRAGRLLEAERLYRLVSDTDPRNARALHLLGVVAHQLERPDAAAWSGGR